jgi:monoamine oxidase
LRDQHVSEAAVHMMNLGSTPVGRFRSFLDVLRELAVNRELRRRTGATDDDQLFKIEGGNDRLPHAFAVRLHDRIHYRCAARRIEHDSTGAGVFFDDRGSDRCSRCRASTWSVQRRFRLLGNWISLGGCRPKRTPSSRICHTSASRAFTCSAERGTGLARLQRLPRYRHPMEVWDATYGQKGARGILMSFVQGSKARELAPNFIGRQLRYGLRTIEEIYPGVLKAYERRSSAQVRQPFALTPTA